MESASFKKIKRSQKMLVILASLAIFVGALCYVFFLSGGSEEAVQTGIGQEDASYQEYQDYISNTNNGVKNLLDGEQLKQIVVNEYPAIDLNLPRSDNPFAKSF